MGWKVREFRCECGNEWEDLVKDDDPQEQTCSNCGASVRWGLSATAAASFSIMSKQDQATHLRKRSRDHTKKMLKKDPSSIKMSRHVLKKR